METNSVQPPSVDVAEMNVIQKIIGIFTSPAKAFASIDLKPTFILPLLIMIVISLLFAYTARDVIKEEGFERQEQIMQERGMDQEQIDQAMAQGEKMMAYTMPVFAVLGTIVLLIVVGGVFLFVGNVVLGGKTTYKKVLSVTAWSWLILSLYSLVMLPLVLAKHSMNVTFSLATFLSADAKGTFLYGLLSKIDIFYIWWIAVYSIGLAVIYKMETRKTAIAVTVVYLIYAVIASSFAGMFS